MVIYANGKVSNSERANIDIEIQLVKNRDSIFTFGRIYGIIKLIGKLEFCEQNTQDIMCPPRNHDISRFVSWYLSVDSGKIGMKGGVHNEPTKNG